MVNVKNLFGMAVMATALVGCSSNDNLAPDGKDNVGRGRVKTPNINKKKLVVRSCVDV